MQLSNLKLYYKDVCVLRESGSMSRAPVEPQRLNAY